MIDKLKTSELWSNCCWATVKDPGNTWEGICSSCGEHCENIKLQEVDIAVLDFANPKNRVCIHRVERNTSVSLDEFIDEFLTNTYGSTSDLEYMYDEVSPILVTDYRKSVEKKEE